MAKQRITIGAIVEIDLGDNTYSYAQLLDGGSAFFDLRTSEKIKNVKELAGAKVIFILRVYDDVITSGRWKKIGKLPIREELEVLPMKFMQDELNPNSFELYNPNTGEITPATREECKGLECAAVWEAEHVEERIRDYYENRPNIWVEKMSIK